jgi:hypothetical protein
MKAPSMFFPAAITPAVVEKILAFLAPLFLDVVVDLAAAREVAGTTLASYGAKTDRELRLVALTIAFSFGALDALGRAASPDLPVNQVIRLRGNANALNRAALQNENRFEKLRKLSPAEIQLMEEPSSAQDLPATTDPDDLLGFARVAAKARSATVLAEPKIPAAPLSRQQRRFIEARAAKAERRAQEQARLAERAARRAAVATKVA